MSIPDEVRRDRINAADRYQIWACDEYRRKLDEHGDLGRPLDSAAAKEIDRLRAACDAATQGAKRVRTGGPLFAAVDEVLNALRPGVVVILNDTTRATVEEATAIPGSSTSIWLRVDLWAERTTEPIDNITGVEPQPHSD